MPADYVNKLARMFQDIKVSEDLNQEFKEAHRNNNEGLAGQWDVCIFRYVRFKWWFVLKLNMIHWYIIIIIIIISLLLTKMQQTIFLQEFQVLHAIWWE